MFENHLKFWTTFQPKKGDCMQIGGTKIGCIQIEVIEEPFCNNHDPQIIKFT